MKHENPYEDFWREVGGAFITIITTLSILAIVGSMIGCSPRIVPVETIRTDTCYINNVQRDSIHVLDSVYVNQYVKGDTIYINKIKWRELYTEKEVHDTLYQTKLETQTIEKIVYQQTKWQELTSVLGKLFLWLLGGCLLWLLFYFVIGRKLK